MFIILNPRLDFQLVLDRNPCDCKGEQDMKKWENILGSTFYLQILFSTFLNKIANNTWFKWLKTHTLIRRGGKGFKVLSFSVNKFMNEHDAMI